MIAAAQEVLADVGAYGGAIDGRAGPETHAAVTGWQYAHGLPATGVLDLATVGDLGRYAADLGIPGFGNADAAWMRSAQDALRAAGVYRLGSDGVFSQAVRNAVEDVQDAHGLPRTGRLDRPTRHVLGLEDPPE